jgi:formyl-CoA transferase
MNIASSSTRLWLRLCDALGKPEWKNDPEWKTQLGRTKHRAAINQAIGEITRQKPASHWLKILEAAGIPAGPINTIDKVFADPQVQHLGIAAPIHVPLFGDTRLVGSAINFDGLAREIRSPTPEPGEHTDEVLQWLGYSREEAAKLRATGVTQPTAGGNKEQAA